VIISSDDEPPDVIPFGDNGCKWEKIPAPSKPPNADECVSALLAVLAEPVDPKAQRELAGRHKKGPRKLQVAKTLAAATGTGSSSSSGPRGEQQSKGKRTAKPGVYQPGAFREACRRHVEAHVAQLRQSEPELSQMELRRRGNASWLGCPERANMVASLTQAQQKRRRFI